MFNSLVCVLHESDLFRMFAGFSVIRIRSLFVISLFCVYSFLCFILFEFVISFSNFNMD